MDFVKNVDAVMSGIKYGWLDKNGKRHEGLEGFGENYLLQLPEELKKSKLGVCWDQVELERELFKKEGIAVRTFFIVYYDDDHCPTHTFAIFERAGKTYWYEHAWAAQAGLHKYDSIDAALKDIREKFVNDELQGKYDPNHLVIYEYEAPEKNLSCPEFYAHCEKGKRVRV